MTHPNGDTPLKQAAEAYRRGDIGLFQVDDWLRERGLDEPRETLDQRLARVEARLQLLETERAERKAAATPKDRVGKLLKELSEVSRSFHEGLAARPLDPERDFYAEGNLMYQIEQEILGLVPDREAI